MPDIVADSFFSSTASNVFIGGGSAAVLPRVDHFDRMIRDVRIRCRGTDPQLRTYSVVQCTV
jgi:hypothetical protein